MPTLKQLKQLCKKYNLTSSGTKKQLGKRLYNLRSDIMSKKDLKIVKDFLKVKTHKRKLKRTKNKSKNRSRNRSKAGFPGLTSILSYLQGENRENHPGTQLAHGYQPTNEQIEQMRLMRQSMKNGVKPYPQQPFRDMRASDVPLTIQEEQSVDTGPRVNNGIVIRHNPIFNDNMNIIMKSIYRIKAINVKEDIRKPVDDNDEFEEYGGHIDKFKNLHLVVNLPDGRCIHVPLTYQEYEKLDHSDLFEYLPEGRIISKETMAKINGYDNEEINYSIETEFMEGITKRPRKSEKAIKEILEKESLEEANLDVVRIYRARPTDFDSAGKCTDYKVQSLKEVRF